MSSIPQNHFDENDLIDCVQRFFSKHHVGKLLARCKEIIIGCILRGDQSLIPRGDTSVKEGDILLMITSDKQKLNTVKELTKS